MSWQYDMLQNQLSASRGIPCLLLNQSIKHKLLWSSDDTTNRAVIVTNLEPTFLMLSLFRNSVFRPQLVSAQFFSSQLRKMKLESGWRVQNTHLDHVWHRGAWTGLTWEEVDWVRAPLIVLFSAADDGCSSIAGGCTVSGAPLSYILDLDRSPS